MLSSRGVGGPSILLALAERQSLLLALWIGSRGIRSFAVFLLVLSAPLQLLAQTPITTWHYNNARTGANTEETLLTTANVNSQTFGKLFSQPVDGFIVGHPLYLPKVNIPGQGVHNVVYVATLHDTVYAFDADTVSAALWRTSLLDLSPTGAITTSTAVKKNLDPTAWSEVGIVSTPVIDPVSGTLYVVAETYENGSVAHRLHALDVATGQEKLGGPTTISATTVQNGITTTFQDFFQMNRPALLLANGHIYIGWGSNGNNTLPCQGWVLSYNANTLQQEGAYTVEPGQSLGSFWQEGAGLSADSDGNIYGENGEGPYLPGANLSISVVKFSQVGAQLSLADWFTPYNHQYLSNADLDLTGGVVILPDQPGPFPHEAVAIGKEGTVYLLNRDNMGQLCSNCATADTQIVQELPGATVLSGTPVYWNNTLYIAGIGVPIVAYPVSNGSLGTPYYAPSIFGAGASPILTANGTSDGIFWFLDGNHVLRALDALTLQLLYTTGQSFTARDSLPSIAHFATPISADGKVFVGTQTSLVVYGLFPALSVAGGSGQSASAASILPALLQVKAVDPYTQNVFPGVTVTFSDGGKGGAFNPPTAVTNSSGIAATSYTLPTLPGSYTVTASAFGYASGLLLETAVAKGSSSTTTTLHSGSNPSRYGQAVTLTATVTPAAGAIPNGETVTFNMGSTVLGTGALSNGAATFTTSTLPTGTDRLAAVYGGDTTFAASSGPLSQIVKYATTTTLSSNLNPSIPGQAVSFRASVTSTGGNIPDGEAVTFKSGTAVLGTAPLASGVATFTISTLPAGNDLITAVYAADTLFAGSYGTLAQKVAKSSTATTLHSSANPSIVGQSVTFTASVTSTAGSVPNGETVSFKDGATVLGTGTLTSGTATFTTSTFALGTNPMSATYAGDATFAASSGGVSQLVRNSTTTRLSSSLNPSAAGQSVTFTAVVTATSGSIPNGEIVTFKSGATVLGTGSLAGGTATLTISTLSAGTNTVVATYAGDTNFRASYGTVSQKVTP